MQALLSIDDYIVEEFFLKANPSFKRQGKGEVGVGLNFDLKRNGEAPQFMICMTIKVGKSAAAATEVPYQLGLKITGFLSFPQGTPEDTMAKMIGLNGLAILYGVARGVVGQVTAQGPHGRFVLPSLNFVDLLKKKAAELAGGPAKTREPAKKEKSKTP